MLSSDPSSCYSIPLEFSPEAAKPSSVTQNSDFEDNCSINTLSECYLSIDMIEKKDSSEHLKERNGVPLLYFDAELSDGKLNKTTTISTMLDSGCTLNLLDLSFANKNGIVLKKLANPIPLILGDGSSTQRSCIQWRTEPMLMKMGVHIEVIEFLVTNLAFDAILGRPWLKKHNPDIDWRNPQLHFKDQHCLLHCGLKNRPFTFHSSRTSAENSKKRAVKEISCSMVSSEEFEQLSKQKSNKAFATYVYLAKDQQKQEAESLESDLKKTSECSIPVEYLDVAEVFSKAGADKLPQHRPFDISIELEKDKKPPYGPIYGLSPAELEALKAYIDENLAKGFIRPSTSSAASPILFVKKKDGSLRLCVDYRGLNSMTVKDRYPLPLIDDLLFQMRGACWFTTLDLRGAYNLVRVKPGDEWKTAFRTRYGLYEYLVMPFGLTNAPAVFQRLINEVLKEFIGKNANAFIDDVIVFTFGTLEEHIQQVKAVLRTLLRNGLYVKLEKCEFHKKSVHFLGFILSTDGISMDPSKVKAVMDWPVPQTVKQLQSFLGFANFYRRFIRGYSTLTTPLTALIKKNANWQWGTTQQRVFEQLKQAFTSAPILAHPDPSKEYILEADASDFAMGAVLSQYDDSNLLHPVAFWSRKLTGAELNWPIYDKELGAIFYAFREWRALLVGAKLPILVWTDHKNLEYFKTARLLNRRQCRWAQELVDYDFRLVYRRGTLQGKPDALSRRSDFVLTEGEKKDSQEQILLAPELFQALRTQISIESDEDGLLDKIRSALAEDKFSKTVDLETSSLFTLEQGLLLHDGYIYVPEIMRLEILQRHHDDKVAGHFGVAKTYELLHRNYWWPGMLKTVKAFVSSCEVCGRSKTARHKPYGFLRALDVPEHPWTSVTLDFIVDLPVADGYDSIIVFVDRFTKMAHFAACKKAIDAEETAKLFMANVFKHHGLPQEIISDRGPQFIAGVWNSFFKALGTKVKLSTAYHPQTDGQSERTNQVLEQYLRCFLDYQQKDWVKLLPLAEFAYNNTVNKSTQYSPFFATYGFHPRFQVHVDTRIKQPAVRQQIADLKELHELMKIHLEIAREDMAKYANQNRLPAPDIAIGSKVWLNRKNIKTRRPSLKLDYKRFGPFKVIEKIGDVAYRLELPKTMKRIHNVFHVSLLEPVVPNSFRGREPEPMPPVEVEGVEEWHVEEILDSRQHYGKIQYLVKWLGWSETANSWEPAEYLEHSGELVEEFHKLHPEKPGPLPRAQRTRSRGGRVLGNH